MEKDLQHIINKSTGFKTPPSYFDALEDQVMNQIRLEQEAFKKNPFTVPDNYFSSQEETIFKKTVQTTNAGPKVISIKSWNLIKYAVSIAAVFLLVLTVFQFRNSTHSISESDFTNVQDYIESDRVNISTYDLQELLSDEFLDNSFLELDISQEELMDYLSYNIDETAFLNN